MLTYDDTTHRMYLPHTSQLHTDTQTDSSLLMNYNGGKQYCPTSVVSKITVSEEKINSRTMENSSQIYKSFESIVV